MEVDKTTYLEISFAEVKDMKISYGDLYWKKSSGSYTKIINAGDTVDFYRVEKFQKVTKSLFIDNKCNKTFIEQGREILNSLLESNDEIERRSCRERLISHVYSVFWSGESKGNLLDFVLIFELSFNGLPDEYVKEMDARAMTFFQRSALCSSLITFSSICLGYTHGSFLKDLYNTCFYFDFSFAHTGFSTIDLKNLESSRENHDEMDIHSVDVKKSIDMFNYRPKHSRLSKLIGFHHELLNGSGEYIHSNQEEIGDLEKIVIWIEHLIPFGKDNYFIKNGEKYLHNLFNSETDLKIVEQDFKDKIIDCFKTDSNKLENVA